MVELPTLWTHQGGTRDELRVAVTTHRRVILCGDCGFGKTRLSKWILGASLNRAPGEKASGKSLFVVQGRPLVGNAVESFGEDPKLPHGVIMSGSETHYGRRVQVASIDTMVSWFIAGTEYPSDITFDLIIQDECDNHFPKFAKFLNAHEARREQLGLHPSYVIGLSGTPQAKGLSDVYRHIVFAPPTDWLIANGYLAPFKYFRATQGKLDKLVKRGGEFTHKSECEAMAGLSGDLVRDWKRYGEGRPTVGFFPRRTHAKEAMDELEKAGLRVAYVDAYTPDEIRWANFRSLNDGHIDYLCNVNLVGRGTDIPNISCIQLCVAMASVKAFLQKVGRGSRFNREKYPDKRDCCIARGTPILTDRGLVPVQDVLVTDRVWDGIEFCSHGGAYCTGTKEVIEWSGLLLTPDHEVLTNGGWKEAQVAQVGGWRAIAGGVGGTPIRTADDSNPYHSRQWSNIGGRSGLFPVWEEGLEAVPQNHTKDPQGMRTLHTEIRAALSGMGMAAGSAPEAEMSMSAEPSLSKIRRSGNRVPIPLDLRRCLLGRKEFGPSAEQSLDHRQNRQQRPLRTGQPEMGHLANAIAQSRLCVASSPSTEISIRHVLRHTTEQPPETGANPTPDSLPMVAEVWDILDAGPRNRYCAGGLIIANCIVDHGGNVGSPPGGRLGFFEDERHWTLDNRTKDPGEAGARPTIECPRCSAVYRGGLCRNCGYEPTPRERRAAGLEFDGRELREVAREEKKPNVKSAEDLMLIALYVAGKSGRTWRQACGMFKAMAHKQGTAQYRIPSTVTVSGHRYRCVRYGSEDSSRRVSALYPFTIGRGNHGGDYLIEDRETAGSAF